ncbi:MAG: PEP-CTERM sorting domain-containing protein [Planctomycetota bacterium]
MTHAMQPKCPPARRPAPTLPAAVVAGVALAAGLLAATPAAASMMVIEGDLAAGGLGDFADDAALADKLGLDTTSVFGSVSQQGDDVDFFELPTLIPGSKITITYSQTGGFNLFGLVDGDGAPIEVLVDGAANQAVAPTVTATVTAVVPTDGRVIGNVRSAPNSTGGAYMVVLDSVLIVPEPAALGLTMLSAVAAVGFFRRHGHKHAGYSGS